MTDYSLYIDKFYSYTCLGFATWQDMAGWLRDNNGYKVAPMVWVVDDGLAAQTEEALEAYQLTLIAEV